MKCPKCGKEATYDERRECWQCFECNPVLKEPVIVEEPKRNYLDVHLTDERVREIVREEIENYLIEQLKSKEVGSEIDELHRPDETDEHRPDETDEHRPALSTATPNVETVVEVKQPYDWRLEAKKLGIPLLHRTKVDVLADIKAKKEGEVNVDAA